MQVTRVDRMSCPVYEAFAIASLCDHCPRGIVYFPTPDGLARADTLAQQRYRSIPRIANRPPNAAVALTRRSKRAHPGLIGEDAVLFARPPLSGKNVAALDR